jgi:hypothetical protein
LSFNGLIKVLVGCLVTAVVNYASDTNAPAKITSNLQTQTCFSIVITAQVFK